MVLCASCSAEDQTHDGTSSDAVCTAEHNGVACEDDIVKIEIGMPFDEVFSLLGEPYKYDEAGHSFGAYWKTCRGNIYDIFFNYPGAPVATLPWLTNYRGNEDGVFDTQQEHHPSADDFELINRGMTYQNVVDILGKPHGIGSNRLDDGGHGVGVYSWIADDGNRYIIGFEFTEYLPYMYKKDLSEINSFLVVQYMPRIWPPISSDTVS